MDIFRKRQELNRNKKFLAYQSRCLAENPFQTMGEVLPMVKSMIWGDGDKKEDVVAPVFLYEQQDESVPYVINTDSSEDDISLLEDDMTYFKHGTRDVSSCFRPRHQQPGAAAAARTRKTLPPPVVVAHGAGKAYRRQESEPEGVLESSRYRGVRHASEVEHSSDDEHDEWNEFVFNRFNV